MRVGAIALFAALLAAPSLARAEGDPKIAAGTELEALESVTLHKAEIAKGSKVAVTSVLEHGGKIDKVSIDLGDGHIVKVALATVRNFFRVVDTQ